MFLTRYDVGVLNIRALRNLDLNLLVAFSVLMQERHVSRAAKKLGIGQPGLSGALGRLRTTFDDPLLVRVGSELQPTPRALELIGPVEEALSLIDVTTSKRRGFRPDEAERTFSIGMTDDHELLVAAALASRLLDAAPRSRLVIRAVDVHGTAGALDSGALDVVFGAIRSERVPSWHEHAVLFEEGYSCVWSPRQLHFARSPSLERYLAVGHALVTFDGDLSGRVDEALAVTGKSRRVLVGVPRFAALPPILSAMQVVSTVPTPIARWFACQRGLVLGRVPVKLSALGYGLVYRQRDAALPELAWFRHLVAVTVRTRLAELREGAHRVS
jgi:LysR family transcriptional activator of mexEF-oprN operon